jgi:hypothetical protein
MGTRFTIEIMPRDGSRHRTLYTEIAELLVPTEGDTLMIWDGYTTSVHSVTLAPTMDPMVFVRGKSLFPEDAKEADDIVRKAITAESWRTLG